MATKDEVKQYLAYWFQLGKKVMTNNGSASLLPQHADNNSDFFQSAWYTFEQYLRDQLVLTENKELYIISGGIASADNINDYIDTPPYSPNEPFLQSGINYPEATWKVAVVLEPGQRIADITTETRVIAIKTPNTKRPTGVDIPLELIEQWRNWANWRVSVDEIEKDTGLNLLSNIPKNIQDELEKAPDRGSTNVTGIPTANLMSDEDDWAIFENSFSANKLVNTSFEPIRTFEEFPVRPKQFYRPNNLVLDR